MFHVDAIALLAAEPDGSGMSSYRMGQIAGIFFLGVIVLLIIKKFFGSRSKR